MNKKSALPEKIHLVTIGLICFNAEDTIDQALNGAIEQTWPNLEILVWEGITLEECDAELD